MNEQSGTPNSGPNINQPNAPISPPVTPPPTNGQDEYGAVIISENTGIPTKGSKWKKVVLIIVIVLLLGGGVVFAMQTGLLSKAPYNESNLVSGVLEKAAKIKSATYKLTGSVKVENRDSDAVAFEPTTPPHFDFHKNSPVVALNTKTQALSPKRSFCGDTTINLSS